MISPNRFEGAPAPEPDLSLEMLAARITELERSMLRTGSLVSGICDALAEHLTETKGGSQEAHRQILFRMGLVYMDRNLHRIAETNGALAHRIDDRTPEEKLVVDPDLPKEQ